MSTTSSPTSAPAEIVWSCVEDGFYVATRDDSFLGFVDRVEHSMFQVCNARSEQIGLLSSLEAAQECLSTYGHTSSRLASEGEGR